MNREFSKPHSGNQIFEARTDQTPPPPSQPQLPPCMTSNLHDTLTYIARIRSPRPPAMPIRPNGFHANASKPAALRLTHTRLSPIHDPSTRLPCIPSTARCASSQAYKQNIAVIGGGITGLTTAYVLSKRQDVKVTLYEASKRFGGWIESKLVDVPGDKGRVLFELGPRTLRPSIPNGFITAALVRITTSMFD